MKKIKREIYLTPKQKLLKKVILNSNFSWIGYGGARGGAKSYGIRTLALLFGFDNRLKLKSLIFRRYSGELLKNHINPMLEDFPELISFFNKSEYILYDENRVPVIQFGYADSDQNIYKFQGTEFDIIFIDEATQCSEKQILFLKTTNRSLIRGFKPKMVLTMNPGNISHSYIKRLFIDKSYRDNENPDDYFFIQSHVWDNVFWVKDKLELKGFTIKDYYNEWSEEKRMEFCLKHSDYADNLKTLPQDIRRAYLFGDWEVFGGMFFKNFNRKKQVIKPFEIPEQWKIIGGIDPGFSSPCSFGITAVDFDGNIYRVFTYYEKGRSPVEHAAAISNMFKDKKSVLSKILGGRKPDMIIAGRDAFARKDRYAVIASEKTFADIFNDYGMYLTPAVTDRKQGWWAWKSLIPDSYYIFGEFNQPLLDELLSVTSDPGDPEDIKGKGNDPQVSDHALDEQRYVIMSVYRPGKKNGATPAGEGRFNIDTGSSTGYENF